MSDSLRPSWNRGGGFQPPPTQSFEEPPQRSRSASLGMAGRSLADLASNRPKKQQPQKVIRYTREKLLSLRGQPKDSPPEELKNLELFVSDVPQDPVCWDADLDAEAIWASKRTKEEGVRRTISRRDSSQPGRWQRGVALPTQTARKNSNTEDPNDLWDDPETEFNFEAMAEASKKLEDELRPPRSRSNSMGSDASEPTKKAVDPSRPLAQSGTTIRSGSGENVNVFEDFDEPTEDEEQTIKAMDEDQSASSRLMAMIGVTKEPEPEPEKTSTEPEPAWVEPSSVPLNPWGQDPLMAPPSAPVVTPPMPPVAPSPVDIQAQLERQRAEEEERKQRMQQQAGVQNQVENVLLERISTILENSWGRSDLGSILSTLHAEDSRVIPLLSNVDALRALLLRHPRRIAIRQDPAMRAEMAALLITNSQWRAEQQNQHMHAQQVELLQRQQQEQQRRLLDEHRARAAAAAAAATPQIIPDAPWYYSDPSKNIQGPFRDQEMRQWLEAGYFKGDLPISQNPNGPFRPLSHVFTDTANAFLPSDSNDEAQAQAEQARAEHERAEKEAAERRERQRIEANDAAAASAARRSSNGGNESSTQLKMMLGLGGGPIERVPQVDLEKPVETKPVRESAPRPALPTKPTTPEVPAASAKPAAPAWGGAAEKQQSSRKSMSEIQLEEAKAQAAAARFSTRSSGSGWANVAASRGGSTGWQGGASRMNTGAVLSGRGPEPARAMSMQSSSGSAMADAQAVKQPQRSASMSGDNAAEAFGAKMSPSLENWCKEQMLKINNTDDLTLVSFCMTLTDPEEIRQYLTTYLGSSPQVSNFAAEFINRKGGTKGKQEEWESTVTTKKGRKKKAGAR